MILWSVAVPQAAPQKMKMGGAAAGAKRLGLRQSPGAFASVEDIGGGGHDGQ